MVWAYGAVLDRAPENERVIAEHLARRPTRAQLVAGLAQSPEGRARPKPHGDIRALTQRCVRTAHGGRPLEVWGDEDDAYAANAPAHLAGLRPLAAALESCGSDVRELVDVGANIGLATLMAASRPPITRITAVEPGGRAFAALRRNLLANGASQADAVRYAVGVRPGRGRVVEDPGNSSSAHVTPAGARDEHPDGGELLVDWITLDRLCADRRLEPDFVKIDVEGRESDVLNSARATLLRRRPYLYVEVNSFTCNAYGERSSRHLVRQLQDYGRSLVWFEDGAPKLMRTPAEVVAFWRHHFVDSQGIDDVFVVPDGRRLDLDRLARLLR